MDGLNPRRRQFGAHNNRRDAAARAGMLRSPGTLLRLSSALGPIVRAVVRVHERPLRFEVVCPEVYESGGCPRRSLHGTCFRLRDILGAA